MIYKPSDEKFLTTNNPKVRLLIANKADNRKTPDNSKFKSMMSNIITNIDYDFELDEQLKEDIAIFDKPISTGSLSNFMNNMNGVSNYPITSSNTFNPNVSKFSVSTVSYNKPTSTVIDDIDLAKCINRYKKEFKNVVIFYDNILKKHKQLWNIIVPYYVSINGEKCSVIDNTYYYKEPTIEYAQFQLDFMLRNHGLFVEIVPITDEDETWYKTSDNDPREIANRYGLSLIDDFTDMYRSEILSDTLQISFINIGEKPAAEKLNVWSCHNYNKHYHMKLNKSKTSQYPLKQVLRYELEKYGGDTKQFQTSSWFEPIKFNPIDNHIRTNKNIVEMDKQIFKNICKELRDGMMEGFALIDLWMFFDILEFDAHIGASPANKPMTHYGTIPNNSTNNDVINSTINCDNDDSHNHEQLDNYFENQYQNDMGAHNHFTGEYDELDEYDPSRIDSWEKMEMAMHGL